MARSLIFLFFSLSVVAATRAQGPVPADSLVERFDRQLYEFPQEKIHLQTDKNHYVSGEIIWFRAFLVDALTHRPDTSSRYVYVELIDPADRVVSRCMIVHEEGAFFGHILLEEGMPQGHYTLRAYTRFMANGEQDYFFRKPIRISDPLSVSVRTEPTFSTTSNLRRVNLELGFRQLYSNTRTTPDKLELSVNDREPLLQRFRRDSVVHFSFQTDPGRQRNILTVDYDRHKQYIEIPPPDDEFDVSFHPEGGHLIAGQLALVGFKALKPNGQAEEVTVELFDQQGESLGIFHSLHQGIGTLRFLPAADDRYYAECTNKAGHTRRFDLPAPREDAVALRVVRSRGKMSVSPAAGTKVKTQPLSLIVHSRGVIHTTVSISDTNKTYILEEQFFPSGVNHILLVDREGSIVSERLVFVLNNDLPAVAFETNREKYGRREQVLASLSLGDENGNPLSGSFSVAVTDNHDLEIDSAYTIYSSLLLDSELRGRIDEPGFYFQRGNLQAAAAADGLMLTQGWRRYDVPTLIRGEISRPTGWHEQYQQISGFVKRPIGSRGSARVPVYAISTEYGFFEITGTDEDGRFSFPPMEFPDSARFVVQATSRRGSTWMELMIDPPSDPVVSLSFPSPPFRQDIVAVDYIAKADRQWSIENGMRTIYLEEIQVTAKKKQAGSTSPFHDPINGISFSWEDIERMNITDIRQLFQRVAGVEINPRTGEILIRGGGSSFQGPISALVLINDMIVGDSFFPFDINSLDIWSIARIEILKGVSGAVFGSRGSGGAVLIYLKDGSEYAGREGMGPMHMKTIDILGYQEPAEFYSPKYETAAERSDTRKPDLRTTIYWNPDVRTDENGRASFDFYAADSPTTYDVVIEGVTDDGRAVRAVETIRRE